MKKYYKAPEMDVIKFESEDVITTSNVHVGGAGENEVPDFEL